MNILPIIIAGITTGGLSCYAVQNGLLTSAIANTRKINEQKNNIYLHNDLKTIITFITAKLVAYTLLGVLLGAAGKTIQINTEWQASMQIIIGIYMLGLAINLLNIHPIFRYFVFQTPHAIQKQIRKIAKGNHEIATPALLGFLTLTIPCGTTLAMQALAVTTGSAMQGGIIMATFVLASSWTFFAIGLLTSLFQGDWQNILYKITAAVLIFIAIGTISGGVKIITSNTAQSNLITEITPQTMQNIPANFEQEKQIVRIKVTPNGYTTDTKILKKGIPVEIILESENTYACTNAFIIQGTNIAKTVPPTGKTTISFIPQKAGKISYSCSAGLYTGEFIIQ